MFDRTAYALWRFLVTFALLCSCYLLVATVVFAFRHPELTDTQRLLRLWDALLWR